MKKSRGFTLIEVLIATVILGTGLLAIFSGLTPCLAMITASKRFQEVQWVFGLGQLKHPMTEFEEVGDLVVEDDADLAEDDADLAEDGSSIGEGYVFSRTVDEKALEDEDRDDGLYVVRTKVSWGEGDDASEEIVQLVWKKDGGEYTP